LLEVSSNQTRSTKDRVKEALFNGLYPLSQFEHVLDLFAGSGALGIEALSRGAKQASFIEASNEAYQVLLKNLSNLNINAKTLQEDALSFLNQTTHTYDLILLDPPYKSGLIEASLKIIESKKLLQESGVMVLLSHKNESLEIPKMFHMIKKKDYGITSLMILEWSTL
jgi:16S rRNA (guanine966-N2)-methyltransferase